VRALLDNQSHINFESPLASFDPGRIGELCHLRDSIACEIQMTYMGFNTFWKFTLVLDMTTVSSSKCSI
jgi:hypothetical protein